MNVGTGTLSNYFGDISDHTTAASVREDIKIEKPTNGDETHVYAIITLKGKGSPVDPNNPTGPKKDVKITLRIPLDMKASEAAKYKEVMLKAVAAHQTAMAIFAGEVKFGGLDPLAGVKSFFAKGAYLEVRTSYGGIFSRKDRGNVTISQHTLQADGSLERSNLQSEVTQTRWFGRKPITKVIDPKIMTGARVGGTATLVAHLADLHLAGGSVTASTSTARHAALTDKKSTLLPTSVRKAEGAVAVEIFAAASKTEKTCGDTVQALTSRARDVKAKLSSATHLPEATRSHLTDVLTQLEAGKTIIAELQTTIGAAAGKLLAAERDVKALAAMPHMKDQKITDPGNSGSTITRGELADRTLKSAREEFHNALDTFEQAVLGESAKALGVDTTVEKKRFFGLMKPKKMEAPDVGTFVGTTKKGVTTEGLATAKKGGLGKLSGIALPAHVLLVAEALVLGPTAGAGGTSTPLSFMANLTAAKDRLGEEVKAASVFEGSSSTDPLNSGPGDGVNLLINILSPVKDGKLGGKAIITPSQNAMLKKLAPTLMARLDPKATTVEVTPALVKAVCKELHTQALALGMSKSDITILNEGDLTELGNATSADLEVMFAGCEARYTALQTRHETLKSKISEFETIPGKFHAEEIQDLCHQLGISTDPAIGGESRALSTVSVLSANGTQDDRVVAQFDLPLAGNAMISESGDTTADLAALGGRLETARDATTVATFADGVARTDCPVLAMAMQLIHGEAIKLGDAVTISARTAPPTSGTEDLLRFLSVERTDPSNPSADVAVTTKKLQELFTACGGNHDLADKSVCETMAQAILAPPPPSALGLLGFAVDASPGPDESTIQSRHAAITRALSSGSSGMAMLLRSATSKVESAQRILNAASAAVMSNDDQIAQTSSKISAVQTEIGDLALTILGYPTPPMSDEDFETLETSVLAARATVSTLEPVETQLKSLQSAVAAYTSAKSAASISLADRQKLASKALSEAGSSLAVTFPNFAQLEKLRELSARYTTELASYAAAEKALADIPNDPDLSSKKVTVQASEAELRKLAKKLSAAMVEMKQPALANLEVAGMQTADTGGLAMIQAQIAAWDKQIVDSEVALQTEIAALQTQVDGGGVSGKGLTAARAVVGSDAARYDLEVDRRANRSKLDNLTTSILPRLQSDLSSASARTSTLQETKTEKNGLHQVATAKHSALLSLQAGLPRATAVLGMMLSTALLDETNSELEKAKEAAAKALDELAKTGDELCAEAVNLWSSEVSAGSSTASGTEESKESRYIVILQKYYRSQSNKFAEATVSAISGDLPELFARKVVDGLPIIAQITADGETYYIQMKPTDSQTYPYILDEEGNDADDLGTSKRMQAQEDLEKATAALTAHQTVLAALSPRARSDSTSTGGSTSPVSTSRSRSGSDESADSPSTTV